MRDREGWVNVKLRRRRCLVLRRRSVFRDSGDRGWVLEFLGVTHGGAFRKMLDLPSEVRYEGNSASVLEFGYTSGDADPSL